MIHSALAACLLATAQGPPQEPRGEPASDGSLPDAQALYEAVLDRYRGAQGLHLVGRMEVRGLNWNGEPTVFENGAFELQVKRPHIGLYTFHGVDTQGEPRNFELGRSEREGWVAYYDRRLVERRVPRRVSMSRLVRCDAIKAWFGIHHSSPGTDVELLPGNAEHPGRRGVRVRTEFESHDLWVDEHLNLVEASRSEEVDERDAIDEHVVYLFERAEPLSEVEPSRFEFGPPARFQETDQGFLTPRYPSERAGTYRPRLRVGHEAPTPALARLDGTPLSLADLRGRVTLLVFWTASVELRRRELPRLQALWNELATQRDDLAVVCIGYKDKGTSAAPAEGMTRFLWDAFGYTLTPALQEYGRASHAFDVVDYPTYVLIGPDGRVVHRANEFQIESLPNAFDLVHGAPLDEADAADFERRAAARELLRELVRDLESVRELTGRYPDALDELRAADEQRDPWGHALRYERDGADFDLRCLGADGAPGGNGPAADLIARYL